MTEQDPALPQRRKMAAYVEYDGRDFVGWQYQTGLRSVQGAVEDGLSVIANERISVRCAGRTDSGVHGMGQVIHFETHALRSKRSWLLGTNANMPPDVSIYWVGEVAQDFDARFRAVSRSYRYVIFNGKTRSALWAGRCMYEPRPLDVERMQAAAQHIVGRHDFSSFRGRDCQAKSPVKCVNRLELFRQDQWVVMDIEAGGFLHNMVRNIVGTLAEVGRGVREPEWVAEVIAKRDRRVAGATVTPRGLYFLGAQYEPEFDLPPFRRLSLPL